MIRLADYRTETNDTSVEHVTDIFNRTARPRTPGAWWRWPVFEGRTLSLGWNLGFNLIPRIFVLRHREGTAFALFWLKWVLQRHPRPITPLWSPTWKN
ncbi:hypothetical protein [Deinococcus kurensis]|uniref:hypothetical protein n=1 Tax=Deinococcus kurensis TaxID=2662757 RepID=UPI0012D2A0F6|nr:hypothetical protein [Deinococcus kurensis]